MEKIKFKKVNAGKYKYELTAKYAVKIPIKKACRVDGYIYLTSFGLIQIMKGYQWDGCSGPTWDDKTNMRAGLVHDALYQLMAEGKLDKKYRETADKIFHDMLIEDGMNPFRAQYYYYGVRGFGWLFI